MSPRLAVIGLTLIGGCSSIASTSENEACLVRMNIPAPLSNCLGLYDVEYKYTNPPRPAGKTLYHTLTNPDILKNYVSQTGTYHCYAAALASSFATLGAQYSQATFAQAISQECFSAPDAPLTFSQIVFAITRVHAPPGVWYSDQGIGATSMKMNALADTLLRTQQPLMARYPTTMRRPTSIIEFATRCQGSDGSTNTAWAKATWDFDGWAAKKVFRINQALPQALDLSPPPAADDLQRLNLYEAITWHFKDQAPGTINGALVPIRDSRHLIDSFFQGAPIVAGLITESEGHVVVIHRMNVAVVLTAPQTVERHPSGFIDWVEVTDSQMPEQRLRIIPGDEFLRNARFIFAIYQDRHQ